MCENDNSCGVYSECIDGQNEKGCNNRIAGVLSFEEAKKLNLMKGLSENNSNPTIFDLSLGNFHYVYGTSQSEGNIQNKIDKERRNESEQSLKTWRAICIGSDKEMNKANKDVPESEKFVRQNRTRTNVLTIPALGSALIQLNEIVDTYTAAVSNNILVTGRFDLKLTLVNKGLISQQGTQIEPCYRGRLYCFVHNLSNKDISLESGTPIASIEFSYVSCFCDVEKRKEVIKNLIKKNEREKRYLKAEYCDEGKGILNVRYFNRKKYLPDSCGLSHISESAIAAVKEQAVINQIIDEVKKGIDKKTSIICALIAAMSSIIVTLLTGYFTIMKPLADECKSLESQVQSYETSLEVYQEELNKLHEQYSVIIGGNVNLDEVN